MCVFAAKAKLSMKSQAYLVLECDGTEVDKDAFQEFANQTLLLLSDSDSWQNIVPSASSTPILPTVLSEPSSTMYVEKPNL